MDVLSWVLVFALVAMSLQLRAFSRLAKVQGDVMEMQSKRIEGLDQLAAVQQGLLIEIVRIQWPEVHQKYLENQSAAEAAAVISRAMRGNA